MIRWSNHLPGLITPTLIPEEIQMFSILIPKLYLKIITGPESAVIDQHKYTLSHFSQHKICTGAMRGTINAETKNIYKLKTRGEEGGWHGVEGCRWTGGRGPIMGRQRSGQPETREKEVTTPSHYWGRQNTEKEKATQTFQLDWASQPSNGQPP